MPTQMNSETLDLASPTDLKPDTQNLLGHLAEIEPLMVEPKKPLSAFLLFSRNVSRHLYA